MSWNVGIRPTDVIGPKPFGCENWVTAREQPKDNLFFWLKDGEWVRFNTTFEEGCLFLVPPLGHKYLILEACPGCEKPKIWFAHQQDRKALINRNIFWIFCTWCGWSSRKIKAGDNHSWVLPEKIS